MIEAPGTFDSAGWLTIGFAGHQPRLGERYISTGSLYLCAVGLLPLGLPTDDPFWTSPPADWTAKKIWSGQNINADHERLVSALVVPPAGEVTSLVLHPYGTGQATNRN